MQFKFLCHCGTKYAFEAEPVNGQMPWAVTCPRCGADATAYANQVIQQSHAAPLAPATAAAPPPPPPPPARPSVRVDAPRPPATPPPAPAPATAPPPASIRIGVAAKAPAPPASAPQPGVTPPDDEAGPPRSSMTFSPVAVPTGAPKLRVGATRYSETFKEESSSSTA